MPQSRSQAAPHESRMDSATILIDIGLSVGLLGSMVGIHNSLSCSPAALFVLYAAIFVTRFIRRPQDM